VRVGIGYDSHAFGPKGKGRKLVLGGIGPARLLDALDRLLALDPGGQRLRLLLVDDGLAVAGKEYLLEVDNPIVVPVGKKVRFLVTANDVIHSWWVPQLGVKTDAIPGFINEFWVRADETGTFRGQCAELCGKDHGFMPIVVSAVSQEDFTKWVAVQKGKAAAESAGGTKTWSKDELMEKGKKAYASTCAACHGAEGKGIPGVFPAIEGSKLATGPVEEHIKTVLHGQTTGKFSAQMPAFAAQLSDADVAAIVTFERNALGNKTGDVAQPSQAKALRK